jgi:hypothetical protein
VHGVVLAYVDTAGIGRVKAVPTARLAAAAAWGVGMSPVFDTFLANDSIVTTDVLGSPDGDLRLYPDLDQLVVLAGQPGWAWAPVDRVTQDGERHPGCTRTLLRRMVTEAVERHGLTFKAAIEIEWTVARGDAPGDAFVPATTGPAYGAAGRSSSVSGPGGAAPGAGGRRRTGPAGRAADRTVGRAGQRPAGLPAADRRAGGRLNRRVAGHSSPGAATQEVRTAESMIKRCLT